MRNPLRAGPTAVTFTMTAATPDAGTPPRPVTDTVVVDPAAGSLPDLVSRIRAGVRGTNLGADDAAPGRIDRPLAAGDAWAGTAPSTVSATTVIALSAQRTMRLT
ncbi:hypothetical protein [Allobranchiibius sp. GilTou38]|uniref:hypothetical protein n=1 Tax=Allobranchiibius sp. GilTou38 TaxID=2815210 RepID=UPI001AA184BA|nr:hypothetical protein [Allobranchiibius sp. GilTou38]MBO1768272.1 hypothetical protein [Allobranchiibius sp. GilTou38]